MKKQPKTQEHYRALSLLGQGSFGKAYLVEEETSHVCYYYNIMIIYRKNM